MKALISLRLPLSTSWLVPEPVSVTPAPARALKVPLPGATLKVAWTTSDPASMSLKLMPFSTRGTSSLPLTGNNGTTGVFGASFTASTCRVRLPLSVFAGPPLLPRSVILTPRVTLPLKFAFGE